MLSYVLAIALTIGSLSLYATAFLSPELHRKDDFLWSGVGLFYALVLWVCAGRITGGVLLGQVAGVSLLVWFGWQTLKLRKAIAHPELREEIEQFSLIDWIQQSSANLFKKRAVKSPKIEDSPQQETVEEIKPDQTLINSESVEVLVIDPQEIATNKETIQQGVNETPPPTQTDFKPEEITSEVTTPTINEAIEETEKKETD